MGLLGTSAVVGLAMLGARQANAPQTPSPFPANPPGYAQGTEESGPAPATPAESEVSPPPAAPPSTGSSTAPAPEGEEGEDQREERAEDSQPGGEAVPPSIEEALLKPQVGDYTLSTKENVTADYAGVATEAMKCVYRSATGAEITHLIIRCKDESTSGAVLESTQSELEKRGYHVTDSNTVRNAAGNELGKRTFLLGQNRTVLWTNHRTFCLAAGPEGEVQSFEKSTSY